MLLQLGAKSKDGLTIIYYEASIDVLPGDKEMSVGLLENLYKGDYVKGTSKCQNITRMIKYL